MASSAPTLDALKHRLDTAHDRLPARLQVVNDYVRAHPQSIALDTVALAAEKAGVSPSTLVRYARHFGLEGYAMLQEIHREPLYRRYADYTERLRHVSARGGTMPDGVTPSGATPGGTTQDGATRRGSTDGGTTDGPVTQGAAALLQEFASAQIESLHSLVELTDSAALEQAVSLMEAARHIHIVGVRRALGVSHYIEYALNQLGQPCSIADGHGAQMPMQTLHPLAGDLVLVVTFSPFSDFSRQAIRLAGDSDAPLLIITDTSDHSITEPADVVLCARDAEARSFRSLSAALCIAQTLCISMGERRFGADR
ncbi:MAG: hypothetical protein CSB44_00565 [Gammaproteobacteria bacterium]|nr:MAG: hypothetical protein CSB44_00565 [Gammaproteobacteria bacterium]